MKLVIAPQWNDIFALSPKTIANSLTLIFGQVDGYQEEVRKFLRSLNAQAVFLDLKERIKEVRNANISYLWWLGVFDMNNIDRGAFKGLLSHPSITQIYMPSGFVEPAHVFATYFTLNHLPSTNNARIFIYAERPEYDLFQISELKGLELSNKRWLYEKWVAFVKSVPEATYFPWGGGPYIDYWLFKEGEELLPFYVIDKVTMAVTGRRGWFYRRPGEDREVIYQWK